MKTKIIKLDAIQEFKRNEFTIDHSCVCGFDGGNHSTTIMLARIQDGKLEKRVVPIDGSRTFPSRVGISPEEGLVFGQKALNLAIEGKESVYSIGKDQLSERESACLYVDGKPVTPLQMLTRFFEYVFKKASEFVQFPIQDLPVFASCPANFDAREHALWRQAVKNTGINLCGLDNEPNQALKNLVTQAPLAGIGLVFDNGGGTTDISIVKKNEAENEFEIKATRACDVAGHDINQLIVSLVKDRSFGGVLPTDPVVLSQLFINAESAKHSLSESDTAVIPVWDGKNYTTFQLTCEEFNRLGKELMEKVVTSIDQTLQEANLDKEQIDYVFLTGGSSQTEMVQSTIESHFPTTEIMISSDPQFDVVQGNCLSAIQKQNETGNQFSETRYLPDIKIWKILPHDLCVAACHGGDQLYNSLIIPKGTRIPTKAMMGRFAPKSRNQQQALIQITKGKPDTLFSPDDKIGQSRIKLNPDNPNLQEQVEISMEVDEQIILKVLGRDLMGDGQTEFEISVQYEEQSDS